MTRYCAWPLFVLMVTSGCGSVANLLPMQARDEAIVSTDAERELEKCLPQGVSLDTVFCENTVGGKQATVLRKLRQLGAWRKGKEICDRWGKPLYFYRIHGIGVPHPNYSQIVAAMNDERRELERHYRIIEMFDHCHACSPPAPPAPQ